ncbi:hypothetical protein D3C85_1060060 [compost metagenome]
MPPTVVTVVGPETVNVPWVARNPGDAAPASASMDEGSTPVTMASLPRRLMAPLSSRMPNASRPWVAIVVSPTMLIVEVGVMPVHRPYPRPWFAES